MIRVEKDQSGFTIAELVIAIVIFGMISVGVFGLYSSFINSHITIKRKSQALALATNQMEYLKSLPYNNLAVQGGSIYSPSPIPSSSTKTINNFDYQIKTNIEYVDDAYDGCANYPNQALKEKNCRNYPAPASAPATDTNPADYKLAQVTVYGPNNIRLAFVDTLISARVAETASTTGALFVNVIDGNGNPVAGANVRVVNNSITPNADLSDTTDSNGLVVIYGLPPDTSNFNYEITASKTGYSSLTTIKPSGELQPNYLSQKIFSQQSSYVTLPIKPQGENSFILETTNTNGTALPGVKVYVKGGYKKYNLATDTSYYFDNLTPDTRPTTDGNGITVLNNLVPGSYYFCGDSGASSCSNGGTNYYLAAAVPYTGVNSFGPINLPIYDSSTPANALLVHNGVQYMQKVRLMLTTNSNSPRISSVSPYEISTSSNNMSDVALVINGFNLPCNDNPASCNTTVSIAGRQATCIGSAIGQQLNCNVNLDGIAAGKQTMTITANGIALTIPSSPHMGAINVIP